MWSLPPQAGTQVGHLSLNDELKTGPENIIHALTVEQRTRTLNEAMRCRRTNVFLLLIVGFEKKRHLTI